MARGRGLWTSTGDGAGAGTGTGAGAGAGTAAGTGTGTGTGTGAGAGAATDGGGLGEMLGGASVVRAPRTRSVIATASAAPMAISSQAGMRGRKTEVETIGDGRAVVRGGGGSAMIGSGCVEKPEAGVARIASRMLSDVIVDAT